MNKHLLVAACTLCMFAASAQKTSTTSNEPAFKKGSKTLGLAIGFGRNYDYYGDYYYSDYRPRPTLAVIYDQGLIDNVGPGNIGIGGVFAIKTTTYKYGGGEKATWSNYIIGVRGTYHLTLLKNKNNKFDPYGGVMAGLRIFRYKDTYYDDSYGTVYPIVGLFVGAKYNFSRHIGAFAELGYDISLFRFGINLNF